jgi:dienelactone hydrolase
MVVGFCAVALSAAAPAAAQTPVIRVSPASALMDEEIKIRLTGLEPDKPVTLRARMEWHGRPWEAHARFVTDGAGNVDVAGQAPASGTYRVRDPMGLFWSMQPEGVAPGPTRRPPPPVTDARRTRFELEVSGRRVASAECERWLAGPGVRRSAVTAGGLVGYLYEPPGPGRHAGILVLGGSEGGTDDVEAALLASHGYTTLALAYFGAPGLPPELANVPLEYFEKALDWLAARESVDAGRLGVVGGSKGAELALLLAARLPRLRAVVARAPSSVVWEGSGGNAPSSSWSYRNEPLSCVPFLRLPQPPGAEGGRPRRLVEAYRRGLQDRDRVSRAAIPVERIRGAVLLVSGRDDRLWPSAEMAEAVMGRLQAHGFRYPAEHLCYEGAGHNIPAACIPAVVTVSGGRWEVGGTPEANARARADSRPKVLRFLRQNLGPLPGEGS